MLKPGINVRATAGMSFSAECRWHFWLGWASLTAGLWSTTYAVYSISLSLPPAYYLIPLYVAFLAPFLTLAFADLHVVAVYYRAYTGLSRRNLAQVILDPAALEIARQDLQCNPLLRWARPPQRQAIREQLLSAAIWWPALTHPQGSPWLIRYGEWLADTALGYIPLACGAAWGVIGLLSTDGLAWGVLTAVTGLTGLGLLTVGYSSIRLAGRRQAVLDFFKAWRVPREAGAS